MWTTIYEDASSRDKRKRKCNDAIERNDDDILETEDDVLKDELHNVEDIETSDEEWEVAINNLRKFKRHGEVEAQRVAAEQNSEVTTTCGNGSEYEESDANLDTSPTTDEEDNMILNLVVGDYGRSSRVRASTLRLRETKSVRQCESEDRHHRLRLESLQSRVADWHLLSKCLLPLMLKEEEAKLQAEEDLLEEDNASTSGATSMVDLEAVHFLSQTSVWSSYLPQPSRD
ncbi:hypothetical protein Cgig2_033603 [Carnegiea gigantea]|uniref:Uncharacterized protein n=1 Tax=Carnegiea gigantea TaxID=171969 RepID=A0A9Q1KNZ0_9CARY|nr:hypothetical protein Cgig2_033603 [Carnegiea gigantea]